MELISTTWDYKGHKMDEKDQKGLYNILQNDWNQTLMAKLNVLCKDETPPVEILVNPNLRFLITSLVFHRDDVIYGKYWVKYDYNLPLNTIKVGFNTLTIQNFETYNP